MEESGSVFKYLFGIWIGIWIAHMQNNLFFADDVV